MTGRTSIRVFGMGMGVVVSTVAWAQYAPHPIPESERWATITHPGNEPYVYSDPYGNTHPLGRVDYEYRISRTEVTAAEWVEFINAYAPYQPSGGRNTVLFTSNRCYRIGETQYAVYPGEENHAVEMGWRYAARYVNWLHNNKATNREAFESGAYDTSTFGDNPDHTFTDQQAHSPGARYWIPTSDELIKAFHFDPNRNGPGQPGYWQYPTTSDTAPIPGLPEQGGETSVGRGPTSTAIVPPVAAYRNVQSPWGLWDASGGVEEYTESTFTLPGDSQPFYRRTQGSSWHDSSAIVDILDRVSPGRVSLAFQSFIGLRVARTVPSPTGFALLSCTVLVVLKRKRGSLEHVPSHRRSDGSPRVRSSWTLDARSGGPGLS